MIVDPIDLELMSVKIVSKYYEWTNYEVVLMYRGTMVLTVYHQSFKDYNSYCLN